MKQKVINKKTVLVCENSEEHKCFLDGDRKANSSRLSYSSKSQAGHIQTPSEKVNCGYICKKSKQYLVNNKKWVLLQIVSFCFALTVAGLALFFHYNSDKSFDHTMTI